MESMPPTLFEAVAQKDYESLASLFGTNARNSISSYLSMRQRWDAPGRYGEEKVDDTLNVHPFHFQNFSNIMQSENRSSDDQHHYYCTLLHELATFLAEQEDKNEQQRQPQKKTKIEVSAEAERLLRDSAAVLAASRPPNNFVVYQSGRFVTSAEDAAIAAAREDPLGPPTFDGSVANATPPPLGGPSAGASSGAGTILHLACALDVPLALAFLLAMGADARASHTAFRRLMIHEAACNGSIQCLTLLLELGQKFGDLDGNATDYVRRPKDLNLPFMPRRIERSQALGPLHMVVSQPDIFARAFEQRVETPFDAPKTDFLSMLRLFRELARQVRDGCISELDAARKIMDQATIPISSQSSLARSCGFRNPPRGELFTHRAFLRANGGAPPGVSDGHGNTPLHWAAFKNETECVALLLQYNADPNARAHPSGWTPLHDAAYSNAKETIELLLNAGAEVDARANSGATPLCFAAQEDAADAAELLLERGADLSARCAGGPIRDDGTVQLGSPHSRFSGYTPLHYCAHYNAHNAARVLLRHPSARKAMDIPDLSDRLPVHVAVARGSSDVLRELLHGGVRVETRVTPELSSRSRLRRALSHGQSPSQASIILSTPTRRRAPAPESPHRTPPSRSGTPVSSPLLRSLIPAHPITSSKPWNCLTQRSIDECRELISQAEKNWAPERHPLFTPADRRAVAELLRVGKHLEMRGTGIFLELWPMVLSFCGRGWFEVVDDESNITSLSMDEDDSLDEDMGTEDQSLTLPSF